MKVFEVLQGTDPNETEQTIRQSFGHGVVSDLLADETSKGDVVDAREVLANLEKKFPVLFKQSNISIKPGVERVRIRFNTNGTGATVEVPPKLKKGLGEVLVLHELAHMLYTRDLLTNKILKYRDAPEAFTVLRVLEDISIERKLEKDFPNAVEVFKSRSQHIIPLYRQHVPMRFTKKVDQLFLFLRGYSKKFEGSHKALSAAETYLKSDDVQEKIHAVLAVTEDLMRS